MPSPGYQGEIAAIICGNGGLNANLNPSKIPLKNVIAAEGTVFRQDHWRKEPGTALLGTNLTAAPASDLKICALYDWHPTDAVQRTVSLRGDGYVYISDPGGANIGAHQSTTTSGSGTRIGQFIQGGAESGSQNRKLFLFRPNKQPVYLDGDATDVTALPKPAADWSDAHPPTTGLVNGIRLFAAGNTNNPHAVYASVAGTQTDFQTITGTDSDTQVLSVFPGVGQRIVAMVNYRGFIVVLKEPFGVFIIDARDASPINWFVQQITDKIGCADSPYAALLIENDVLFLASDGQFYLLSAVIAAVAGQQPLETANIGMDLDIYEFLLSAYARGLLDNMQSVYFPFWQTAIFSVTGPGSTTNNTLLYFDFNAVGRQGGEPRFSYSYRDAACSLALRIDPADNIPKPFYGDYSSDVILMEQDVRTAWNGAQYPWTVQTPHSNFGEFENLQFNRFVQFANRNKLWDMLEVEYVPFTNATVTVQVFVDGVLRQTLTLVLAQGGKPFGAGPTDTAAFILGQSLLAGGVTRSVVKRLNCGAGKRISFLFTNQTPGEDVAITHLFVGFRPGDTTQSPRTGF